MAKLQQFNQKFVLDNDKLAVDEALVKMLISSPEEVKFHLECCVAAVDKENGLRYFPHPKLYLRDITDEDIATFMSRIRSNVFGIVDRLENAVKQIRQDEILQQLFAKCDFKSPLAQMLQFTLLTCDVKLINCSQAYTGPGTLWAAQCNPEKERHFAAQAGPVTYLVHRTKPQCVYSIIRNGIMSMSNEQNGSFRTVGAAHGAGIYMSVPGRHKYYGKIVLCYAVKDAGRCYVGNRMYVVQENQICLRAVVWNPHGEINKDRYILAIVKLYHESEYQSSTNNCK